MLGIWAAVAERHWFLRVSVVALILLAALLIPAYEVLVEFGIQIATIALALRLHRHGFRWPRKFSMATVLLAMVVAAVTAAIWARVPTWPGHVWTRLVGIGLFAALASLLCLWIACGAARWRYRLAGGAVGVVCLLAAYYIGGSIQYLGDAQYGSPDWQRMFEAYFQLPYFKTWLAWALPTILVGVAVMVGLLTLARVGGWFTMQGHTASRSARLILFARSALIFFAACITIPLLLILYALTHPPDPPAISFPYPNGYEDLIAAGEMAPDMLPGLRQWSSMKAAEQAAFMEQLQPAFARIAEGLQKESRVARPYADRDSPEYENDVNASFNAQAALIMRMLHSEQFGTNAEYRGACLDLMQFSEEVTRGGGIDIASYFSSSMAGARRLLDIAAELNASECRALVQELELFSQAREPRAAKVAVQKIVDQRFGWQPHLTYLLSEWSGRESYPSPSSYLELRPETDLRLMLTAIAAQAFLLDHGHPPDSLAELTPIYLAEVPLDPLGSGPLNYRRDGDNFTIYSVGPDSGGDLVLRGPLPIRLRTQGVRALQSLFDEYIAPHLTPSITPAE